MARPYTYTHASNARAARALSATIWGRLAMARGNGELASLRRARRTKEKPRTMAGLESDRGESLLGARGNGQLESFKLLRQCADLFELCGNGLALLMR